MIVNLYQEFRLDPSESCQALGIQLSAQEVKLLQQGHLEDSAAVQRLRVAFGILAHEVPRRHYDDALRAGSAVAFSELEHLANFGSWPVRVAPATAPVTPPINPFTTAYQAPVPAMAPQMAMATTHLRPYHSTRVGLALLDSFIAICLVGSLTKAVDHESFVYSIVNALVLVLYFWVPEVLWGGTPAKLMTGYTVRDQHTGQKLSWGQSAKRNWWRLVAVVPGVGTLVSIIAGAVYGLSISDENNRLGIHDRLAQAEVVKKNG